MSTWRRKAIECLPEHKKEFERLETSIYDVFFELLPSTIRAHKEHNHDQLKRNYDFAEWCIRQRHKELWNAAGTAFYEHLCDNEQTMGSMQQWVKKEIYLDIRPLLETRKSGLILLLVDRSYGILKSQKSPR